MVYNWHKQMKKIMKVCAMLLCIAIAGAMSSCSKDNEDLIVGKWKLVSLSYGETVVTSGEGIGLTVEYADNGNFTILHVDGITITGTYSINKETLSLFYDGETEVHDIVKLDKKDLCLKSKTTDVCANFQKM